MKSSIAWAWPPFLTGPAAIALLVLRVAVGWAFMIHGWGKIQHPFGWMGANTSTPAFLQALAALSEFAGGLAWILGLLTPLASLGILCTMCVAVGMQLSHGAAFVMGDETFELPLAYLAVALVILWVGPGSLSLDRIWVRKDPRQF